MDRIEKGKHAQRLLDDPVLTEILQSMEDNVVAQWKTCDHPVARENCYFHLQGIRSFREVFQKLLNDATMAQHGGKIKPW